MMTRIPPFAASYSPSIFWVSVSLCLLCVWRASRTEGWSWWDGLFFLCGWQTYDFEFWEYYLSRFTHSDGYFSASAILIVFEVLYIYRRGLPVRVGFSKSDAYCYLKHFAALTLLIPTGLWIGFLRFHPALHADIVSESLVRYFLFVGPTEELLFRGIMLNLLLRRLRTWPALLLTTAVFATMFTHIAANGPFPNWTYVGFAFVAGLAYGHSYLKSRNIAVAILLHGTVDSIWRLFLGG